jgi:PAS domain-containing protein
MVFGWALAASVVLAAIGAAAAGVAVLAALNARRQAAAPGLFLDDAQDSVFLFDGEVLVDASAAARALLASSMLRGSPWQGLMAFLVQHFPDADQRIANLQAEGRFLLESSSEVGQRRMTLLAEWRGGMTRLSLSGADTGTGAVDPLSLQAMREELNLLREITGHAPLPIWIQTPAGRTIWANTEYLAMANEREGDSGWPLPTLISPAPGHGQKFGPPSAGAATAWFRAAVHPGKAGQITYGLPISDLVQAEASLRDFTQTLTKTFAHLPIGLAIFDRSRQLALFNPALLDLTTLPVGYLADRPTLFDFLDRLRDLRMIPEPKDYPGWRKQMSEIEEAALTGLYEEIWSLPDARTYRVLGRPHPDGALALLFEDITTETIRSRRYKADLELGQSVIDAMEEAIIVFSPAGQVVLSNGAYADMWGHDPSATVLADASVQTLASRWQRMTEPVEAWSDVVDFVMTIGQRRPLSSEMRMSDGRLLRCRLVPLQGGATMLGFRTLQEQARRHRRA